jgi:hypothetical protein
LGIGKVGWRGAGLDRRESFPPLRKSGVTELLRGLAGLGLASSSARPVDVGFASSAITTAMSLCTGVQAYRYGCFRVEASEAVQPGRSEHFG